MTLEELFRESHVSLFRFVARMTNDPEFAKDIVQETFLHIAERDRSELPSRAWLFQIARNLARSELRKRTRRLQLLRQDGAAAMMPDSPRAPDVEVEEGEVHRKVRTALSELLEKERTILLLREEGFAHREIAEAVGTTTGSVGTMYARALRKLEARLEGLREEME